jgi:hypothetical protein
MSQTLNDDISHIIIDVTGVTIIVQQLATNQVWPHEKGRKAGGTNINAVQASGCAPSSMHSGTSSSVWHIWILLTDTSEGLDSPALPSRSS